ncbi:Probable pre-mRNA-splicing factor ATP-dependent RNA helicase mog-4 [Galdieria sulphuraria]|uniref:RNA helicase n=1 Tax=Galdieria sulphuraria TaxID=130081 RepID=M2Y003_GALSU|nr:pre-mRNA-splicing factor ATP-dependent RNA helicase [Galdieria sulphuraria]EME29213.1 pre-mRNA-splicing factor ATP-dependent RNA helicase [Galdieria sulphuraria]GJD11409.1 Probable pre-mRNA-splicing factor ATP-dependent RNA helicase mog-4 [Galdieria sulphuraria]|eukprot:XP_005705733.1 pre-mRNA-splicing factor ATP-dependent RNA helicase [Galdieria sulphuraria]
MSSQSIESWISEHLYQLIGFSDQATAQFIEALARKASNPTILYREVTQYGFPQGKEVENFATSLFNRVNPNRSVSSANSTVKPREKAPKYELLLSSDEEESLVNRKTALASAEHNLKRAKRRKRSPIVSEEEDEQEIKALESRLATRAEGTCKKGEEKNGEGRDQNVEKELERQQDMSERDAFAKRLMERDSKRKSDSKEEQVSEDVTRNEEMINLLRELSRQEYLKKRERRKLRELEAELRDEIELFGEEQLTEKERKDWELKKQLYEIASKRVKEMDQEESHYKMPDPFMDEMEQRGDMQKKLDVLTQRFKEAPKKEFKTDQEEWEEQQISLALSTRNSSDSGKVDNLTGKTAYELVLDDSIDFISEDILSGQGTVETKSSLSKPKDIRKECESLPIYPFRDELLQAIEAYKVLVVVGETGSGKTTQLPQYLHDAGYTKRGKIGCTQPRRVAAMSVADRVSKEMKVKLGSEVGYSIRFEDCTCEKTVIKYMTDGMLLREFLNEPDLASYSVIIIDEAHERSLHTDILMALVKDLAREREDIKVIISSATLNAEKFSVYFDDAPVFNIPGRRFPVDLYYTKAPEADYVDAACITVLQIHATQPAGDILVFLTGQDEIESAVEMLNERTRGLGSRLGELIICPIYSTLPSEQQAKIFDPTPPGARKVVLATNIAETSVTIDGVVYVIDPGFCKQKRYDPRAGIESLLVVPISRASAIQRAGRAGRTQPGKCFRLYTKWSYYNEMSDETSPEILRTNLSQVVLSLKSLGIDDLIHFDFLDKPPTDALIRSLEQLYALGALNDRGELTKLGRRMAELPLDPPMSKCLIASEKYGCSEEIITICAMLSVNNSIFYRPKDKAVMADSAKAAFHRAYGGVGDHLGLLACYCQWMDTGYSTQWCYENFVQVRSMKKARDIRDQLDAMLERVEVSKCSTNDHEKIRKALVAGFFYHVACLQKNGSYRTIKNPISVHIHPSSSLFKSEKLPRWILYHELVFTSDYFVRQVTEIDSSWLLEVAPHYYREKEVEDTSKKKMPRAMGAKAK